MFLFFIVRPALTPVNVQRIFRQISRVCRSYALDHRTVSRLLSPDLKILPVFPFFRQMYIFSLCEPNYRAVSSSCQTVKIYVLERAEEHCYSAGGWPSSSKGGDTYAYYSDITCVWFNLHFENHEKKQQPPLCQVTVV